MKRKNKPIRRPDAVQPLPLPADADEIAFAHGVTSCAMMPPAAASRRRIWCSRHAMPSDMYRQRPRHGRGKNPIPVC